MSDLFIARRRFLTGLLWAGASTMPDEAHSMTTIDETVQQYVENAVQTYASTIAKGDPGEPGEPGPPGNDGVNGQDGIAVTCPPWINGQDWTAFTAYRDAMASRCAAMPKPSGAKIVHDTVLSGSNQNAFCAVVKMSDGDGYFLAPYSATSARIYRQRTGKYVTPAGSYPGASAYSDAKLLPSGRIILASYQATSLVAFNPYTEAVDTLVPSLSGSYKYNGVGISGKLAVFAPHNATQAGVWDEDSKTWSLASGAFTTVYAYAGAVTLPDGKVLFVPHWETRIAIYDPVSHAVTFGPAIFPGNESFVGGDLIDDENIILYNHKADRPWIYNFVSGVASTFPVATGTAGVANFRGGLRLVDGRFRLNAFQANNSKIVDVVNGTAYTCPGSYGSGAIGGSCLMDNGDVIEAPFNMPNGTFAMTGYGFKIDPEYLTNPHVN